VRLFGRVLFCDPEWRMRAALMVHYLERISDHGVDIGGSTVFLVTGERI
jgi:phosphate transport system protein